MKQKTAVNEARFTGGWCHKFFRWLVDIYVSIDTSFTQIDTINYQKWPPFTAAI
ncbi:hypothetical protein [Mucilaginibacter sp. UYCu711]|uniref:hypothetical protein n=1 Tax=Mucilaginibacter sp. UYCu711 TaxID=3156339 RepID=UPI003D21E584